MLCWAVLVWAVLCCAVLCCADQVEVLQRVTPATAMLVMVRGQDMSSILFVATASQLRGCGLLTLTMAWFQLELSKVLP